MNAPRVMRYQSADELSEGVAHRLAHNIVMMQQNQPRVDLCLTGGRIANQIYGRLGNASECGQVDPEKLHVWWGDDRFVPAGDPDRNSLQSLLQLSKAFHLDPANTHVMPAADGRADPDEAAYSYAEEVGDTIFDICLLGMGPDGHVASLFPGHPAFVPETSQIAVGVDDAPKPPPQRISLTLPVINRSRRIWFLVSGGEKAEAVSRVFAGDQSLPATLVHGTEETCWMTDPDAAGGLPRYNCSL
ncbi:6-phosphogluconolactonase [Acidipropionibacterium thoenii]|uniref:6-phosphogluconolactonase n=1 Tax=Acidipropionibacterium thoenii TaxID=1751 RepID=UPI00048191BC|nr:6-phosphogluconolactonase [Acidipropionibacterium thoenii]